ncbi:MAG: methyltransferase domain-containing protein [Deltaproteobacteria bacterium]|nr:methyltransferase domain-containing protein [Deltaproteobacteria bacterium]
MRLSPPSSAAVVARVVARLREAGTLVDLAAGDGTLVAEVARARPDVALLGYERDPGLVAGARARGIARATFALFDLALDRPPPARGRVDVVVAPFVLGAQPEDGALFTHLRRLLREGGLLLAVESDDATARRVGEILVRRGFALEATEALDGGLVATLATPDPARAHTTTIRGWD